MGLSSLYVYNPAAVLVIFGVLPISGFAPETFLSVEMNEDRYTKWVGIGGEVARARTNDMTATVTFTLSQASPSNDALSLAYLLDQKTRGGDAVVPFLVKDIPGRTLIASEFSWIVRPPVVEFARDAGTRAWQIECANLQMFAGGLAQPGGLGVVTGILPRLPQNIF